MIRDSREKYIFGWENAEEAANDLYTGFHRTLLNGEPVFLYRNTKGSGNLLQVVVVRNLNNGCYTGDFGVGLVYTGYTELYPHIAKDFIIKDVVKRLEKKDAEVEKEVIEVYKQLIERKKENEQ